MYRISATMLDGFRLLREADFMTPEEFDARLRRDPLEPSEAMRVGTAFHAIADGTATLIGSAEHGEPVVYQFGGFDFDAESADRALAMLRGGVPEPKRADTVIETRHGPAVLVGKADYLRGLVADEIKTKIKRDLDPENYVNAMQWRVYVRVFGVRAVMYHLVRLDPDKAGIYHATADTLTLYPYPGLAEEVDGAARDLVDYAASRGLLDYLRLTSEAA